jgi:hypothetical protein
MTVFKKMQQLKIEDKLTFKEEQLVDFILNNKIETKGLNMEQLAEASDTSTGTILRLSQKKLNLNGFSELKEKLLSTIPSRTMEVYNKDYKTRIGTIVNQSYDNVLNIPEDISKEVIKLLLNSRSVLIFDPEELCRFSLSKRLSKLSISHHYKTQIVNVKNTANSIIEFTRKENNRYNEILSDTIYDNNLMEKLMLNHNHHFLLISVLTEKLNKEDNEFLKYAVKNNFKSIVFVSEDTKELLEEPDKNIVINLNGDIGNNKLNDHHLTLSLYLKEFLIKIEEFKN